MAIDWRGVKREFESNTLTLASLAKVYGCRADTIRKKAAKEGWKKTARKNTEDAHEPAAHIDAPHSGLDDHRSLWRGVKKRLVAGLETKDVKAGIEELKVAKLAGEVLTSVIKGERLALGLAEDEDDGAREDGGLTGQMDGATAPRGADAAVDGE
ncbi:MAG: hypothetical protein HZB85_02200 [Deltaproteobacteria bacterium]|nr:hypothetical protein [Deltaproteobacteria bacterium]